MERRVFQMVEEESGMSLRQKKQNKKLGIKFDSDCQIFMCSRIPGSSVNIHIFKARIQSLTLQSRMAIRGLHV